MDGYFNLNSKTYNCRIIYVSIIFYNNLNVLVSIPTYFISSIPTFVYKLYTFKKKKEKFIDIPIAIFILSKSKQIYDYSIIFFNKFSFV